MSKTKKDLREVAEALHENSVKIRQMAETLERENRARTEAEEVEYQTLVREQNVLEMKYRALTCDAGASFDSRTVDEKFREALHTAEERGSKTPVTLMLTRAIQTTSALANTGIIPVAEQEMLDPLRAGLIYDKVGITIRTGLVDSLRWPKHGKATAQFVGEAVALTPTAIDWDAITVSPKRLGVAIDVSRQELYKSEGVVESVIRAEMPQAVVDKINDALFATDTTNRVVYGPFATAGTTGGCEKVDFAAEVPTRAELLEMKATVASAGISTSSCCWVMTEVMKAKLEDVKVDAGSGRFLCEDGKILGYPVFCTDSIGDGNIGFGDWSYQAAGFFGGMNLVVDPYSLALNDATRFVLNTEFATVTLRPEAFVLGSEGE